VTPGLVTVGFLHPGEWHACFGESLLNLLFFDASGECRIVSHARGRMALEVGTGQIVSGRNQLARVFLDESDGEWLFMIDSDMGFAPDTVERLIATATAAGVPVVGGLAFACKSDGSAPLLARRYRCTPTLYRMTETDTEVGFVPIFDYPRNQVVTVDATGAACLLIHRSALEAVRERFGHAWFNIIEVPKGKNGTTSFSEDLSFCVRLTACGIPMHVDTSVKTCHDKGAVFYDEELFDLQQAQIAGLDGSPLINIVIPTYGRADRLAAVAQDAIDGTINLARVTFVVEAEDTASVDAIQAIADDRVRCLLNTGPRTYAGAINTAVPVLNAPWLFTGADDLHFTPRWDVAALKLARTSGAAVVGTNDLGHPAVLRGDHSTHSLVSTDYIRTRGATADGEPGKVLHDYHHNFVDNELVTVARRRGLYVHCHAAKVEHLHPVWGKGEPDDTYVNGNANYDADQAVFRERMAALK
jgi:hypothetical protein